MPGEKRKMVAFQLLFLVIVLCLLGFAACKKAAEVEETPAPGQERKAEPTRITDATVLSTHVWKQPTTIIEVEGRGHTGRRDAAPCFCRYRDDGAR